MGRPSMEAASPSTLAPPLLRWLAAAGADAVALAEGAGLPRTALELDEVPMTAASLARLFVGGAEALADPHFALRLPRELAYRRYDGVALAAGAAASPRDVLAIHARYAPLVLPQLEAELEEAGEVGFRARFRGHARGLGVQVDEYVLAVVLARCRRGGSVVNPRRVFVTSARPRDVAPLYAALGTREVVFGSEVTGIDLALEEARLTLPSADPALLATAEHLAAASLARAPRAAALADAVAAKIDAALPSAVAAETIAALLHMSSRTLQRRLEAEGTRFSELLDRVRERRARALLETPTLPLAEVAYRSGFADLATFSRAFKRWTGVPPGTFRRARG